MTEQGQEAAWYHPHHHPERSRPRNGAAGGPLAQVGPRWSETRFLVVDTETTGVDVREDRVVELGAVYFESGRRRDMRRMRINPQRPIPVEASEIHGIYDHHVADKPTFAEVAPRFLAHVQGEALSGPAPWLVGYNANGFDIPLLNAELSRIGLQPCLDPQLVLDLMIFVRWHHRDLRSRSLVNLCVHYGISLQQAHSATADAQATGALLLRMVEDGLIPDGVNVALTEQRRLAHKLDEEWRRYAYWLYHDRADHSLRLGAGRHIGTPLCDIEPDYLDYLTRKIPDLPGEVREIFQQRARS